MKAGIFKETDKSLGQFQTVAPQEPNEIDYLRQERDKLRAVIVELQEELLGLYRRVHGQDRPGY